MNFKRVAALGAALLTLMVLGHPAAAMTVCSPPVGTTGLIHTSVKSFTKEQRTMVCATNRPGSETQRDSCYRRYVNDQNIWMDCADHVPDGADPRTPAPEPGCKAEVGIYHYWGGEEQNTCTSLPPGTDPPNAALRLPAAAHGALARVDDHFGSSRGTQYFRCHRGEWKLISETCVLQIDVRPPKVVTTGGAKAGDAKVGPVPRQK